MADYLKIQLLAAIFLMAPGLAGSPGSAADPPPLPLSVQRVLYQAQTLIADKQLEAARLKLEAYRREKKHSHYMVAYTLGDIRMLSQDYPRAARAYRKAIELKEDFAPAWMNLGKAAYEMADYQTAGDCFHQAYRTASESHPERLYYSATAYLLAGASQKGLAVFEILLDKHLAVIKLEWKPTLVQLYLDLGRPLAALPIIEALAEKSAGPEKMQWQETLLGHYLLLGKTDRALAYTRELTRAAPTVPRWWKAQAHLLLQKSDYEAALQALMIYAKLTEPDETEKMLLADLNLQVGIPAMAVQYYRTLTDKTPNADIITRLAHALWLSGHPDKALERIDHSLENQTTPELLWMKGELLYEMKAYPAAAETFRRCTSDRSRAGQAWLMAGYASWLAKNIPAAQDAFSRAADYPMQKKNALAALKELSNATVN